MLPQVFIQGEIKMVHYQLEIEFTIRQIKLSQHLTQYFQFPCVGAIYKGFTRSWGPTDAIQAHEVC